jgi:hypothetical protein
LHKIYYLKIYHIILIFRFLFDSRFLSPDHYFIFFSFRRTVLLFSFLLILPDCYFMLFPSPSAGLLFCFISFSFRRTVLLFSFLLILPDCYFMLFPSPSAGLFFYFLSFSFFRIIITYGHPKTEAARNLQEGLSDIQLFTSSRQMYRLGRMQSVIDVQMSGEGANNGYRNLRSKISRSLVTFYLLISIYLFYSLS